MTMKIITTPPSAADMTRDEWVAAFLHAVPSGNNPPTHVPTGYRDMGAAVRFSFANGHLLEWHWQEDTPTSAIQDAIRIEALSPGPQ